MQMTIDLRYQKLWNFRINCSKMGQILAVDSKCDVHIRLSVGEAL